MTTWPTVALTGHRPKYLHPQVRPWVQGELRRLPGKLRDEFGTTDGVSGMAVGSDLWWADGVVQAGLQLHAHVPFPDQPAKWLPGDKAEWGRLMGLAASTKTYGARFTETIYEERDIGMVDVSAQLIGVWVAGQMSGTRNTLAYAVRRGMRPIWVDPELRRTVWPSVESWRAMLVPRGRRRRAA